MDNVQRYLPPGESALPRLREAAGADGAGDGERSRLISHIEMRDGPRNARLIDSDR
jgi:hypothetical protein